MRNAISILLIVILVIATPVMLLVTSIKQNVVTAKFVKHELATQNAYGLAVDQINQQIGNVKNGGDVPITAADLQALASRVITTAWLQQSVEESLDRIFAWFKSPDGTALSLPVDFTQPKAQLNQGIDDLLTSKIATLPECPKKGTSEKLCRTGNFGLPQFKEKLKENGFDLAALQTQLPDTIDLTHPVLPTIATDKSSSPQPDVQQKVQPILDHLTKAKTTYHQVLKYYLYAVLAYGILVLGYVGLNIRGWRRLTRWLGILFLSIGVLPLAIGLASRPVVDSQIIPHINLDASVPAAIRVAVPNLIHDVQHALFTMIIIIGATLVLLGLGAVIGARWMPSPVPKKV